MTYAENLPYLLKELKLPASKEHWKEVAKTALKEKLSYGDFLAKLLDLDLTLKEQNRQQRAYKQSKLPPAKTLSTFDFVGSPSINRNEMEQLAADSQWVKNNENLILLGASGAGKTHLACAIAYSLLQKGTKVLFTKTTLLVQSLQQAKADLKLNKELNRLARFDLLILDDIGYVRKSEQETSVLFELIENRYETGSLLITANHPFSKWNELFPEPIMATAAVDRLIHHANIIHIKEPSFREKQAKLRSGIIEKIIES